jgi:hypothetical protein
VIHGRVLPCNLSPSINKTLYVRHNTSQAKSKSKQAMLDLYALYAPGLALLRVKILKTCGLWTSGNLLLGLLLLRNEPTDVGSYTR